MIRLFSAALLLASVSAFAVEGTLSGTNSWAGPVTVTGDVTIPSGSTLTIQPGAVITAASGDTQGSGDASKVEIFVSGTLIIAGVNGGGVTLTGSDTGTAAWGGIVVKPGGTATISYATFDKLAHGVIAQLGASGTTTQLTMSNSSISGSDFGVVNASVATGGTLTTTLTNLAVAADTGLSVTAGDVSATDSSFSGGSYGLRQNGGGTVQLTRVALTKNSYGLYLTGAGTTSCDRCTIAYSSSYGIYEYSTSSSSAHTTTVVSSIISHNGGRGVYRASSSGYGSMSVTTSNVWGNNGSVGTGGENSASSNLYNFSSDLSLNSTSNRSFNPLYVDAANDNFRLTHRSPSRKSGASGVDQGALAYTTDQTATLQGEFWENATLSGANPVVGDLLVAPGVTLTLSPGATLTFAASDGLGGGLDAAKGEIIVWGTLSAVGVSGSPITLTGAGSGTAAWGGVNVLPGGAATLANAAASKMELGLQGFLGGSGTTTSLTVSNATISSSDYGVVNNVVTSGGTLTTTLTNVAVAADTGLSVTAGNVSATDSSFSGGSYGLRQNGGGTVQLTRVALTKNSYGLYLTGAGTTSCDRCTIAYSSSYGIYEYSTSSSSAHTTTVVSSIISHNGGRGVYRASSSGYGSMSVTTSNVWGNNGSVGTGGENSASSNLYNFSSDLSLNSTSNRSFNPLYVDAANDNFRLTHRSPSRKSGASGVDQGALAYTTDQTATLQGEFWENATLSGANTVVGDLLVGPGVTLTLSPGATLTFSAADGLGGSSASQGEVIVWGTLSAVGVSGSPITLTSSGTGTAAWGGVNVRPGGAATLANAAVSKMGLGLQGFLGGSGTTTSLTVSNATISSSDFGVVNAAVTSGGSLTTTLTGLTITADTALSVAAGTLSGQALSASGGSYGLLQSGGGTVQLERAAFTGNSYGLYLTGAGTTSCDRCTIAYSSSYGIYEYSTSSSSAHTTTVVSSIISHNGGRGVYRASSSGYGSMGVTYSNIWGNNGSVGSGSENTASNNFYNYSTTLVSPPATASPYNISANPLYADATMSNYSLQSTSPSRGAGASGVDQGAFPYSVGAVATVTVSPGTATVNAGGITGFAAQARDAQGNIVNNATFTWTVTPSAGTISSSGVLTASCTPGTYTAAITATSTNGTSATASVVINIGPASQVTLTPANTNVKSQATQQYTATVRDSCNNVITGPSITWSSNATAGTITSTGLFTASCTRNAYPNGVTATAGSLSGSVTVNVVAGDPFAVGVTPSSVTVPAGTTQQFAASVADGCGNTVSTPVTWSTSATGSSINGTGLFSAGQINGTFNNGVTATAGSKSGTATVTVTGGSGTGSVASVVVTPGSASLAPGGQQTFTATAYDSNGQVVAGQTATWTASSGGTITSGGVFTAGNTAGTYGNAVTATISGISGTANVTVNPGAVATVTVSPATVTVAPGGQVTFNAVAKDAYNNTVSGAVTWSATSAVGTITQGGVLSATTSPGTYAASVTATVGSVSGTADVTVANGALSQLSVTPAAAQVQAGAQVAFTAQGRDASSNPVAVTPTWSVVNGGGTISSGGIFTAGTTAGTFANTVKAEAQGLSAFASVTVLPGPVLSVTVTPGNGTVQVNGSLQFTAEAKDAFDNIVATGFTWTAQSGSGSITQGGFFTAAADPGSFPNAISATASGITGFASVTLTPAGTTGGGTGNTGGGSGVTGGGDGTTGGGDGTTGGGSAVTGGGDGNTGGGSAATGGGSAVTGGGSGATGGGSGGVNGGTGCGCSSADASLFGLALVMLARFGRRRVKA